MNIQDKIQKIIYNFNNNEYDSVNGKALFELDMNDLNNYVVSIEKYKEAIRERDEYYNQLDDISCIINL